MKAEQRKELETNTLADKMGHVVQRVKGGERRTILIYVAIAVAIVVGIFLTYRWWVTSKMEDSERWVKLDDGSEYHVKYLAGQDTSTNAGKAALLQVAWFYYWEGGVKMLGVDQKGAVQSIVKAEGIYREALKICADDKVYEPQAMLGIAVVEEAKAAVDPKFLTNAAESYEEVFKKYEASAEGKYAKKRFDELKDKKKRAEIEEFYRGLQLDMQLAQHHAGAGIQGGFPMPPIRPPQPKVEDKKKDK